MPNNCRTLGAMLKHEEDNDMGFMLWHDMIVPRKNPSQQKKSEKAKKKKK